MSHTKGPWLVSKRHAHAVIATHDLGSDMPICVMIAGDDAEANARLIASAPDLLSLVKQFVLGAHGPVRDLSHVLKDAVELITKIEKKEQKDE